MSKESFKSKIADLNQTHTYIVECGTFFNTISAYRNLLNRINDCSLSEKWFNFLKKEKYIRSKALRSTNINETFKFPYNKILEDCKNIINLLEEEIKLCQEPSIGNAP